MAKADSTFLFFYSGHATVIPTRETPREETRTSRRNSSSPTAESTVTGQKVVTNLVSDDDLMRLLSYIPSRNKIVLIDACYSGGFIGDSPAPTEDLPRTPSLSISRTSTRRHSLHGALVVTAAGETEASYEAGEYEE
jgi:hypothetical protein